MNLLVLLIILLVLFGGGGYYAGGPLWGNPYYGLGGGLVGVLVVLLILRLFGII